jgi:hypothetical protein
MKSGGILLGLVLFFCAGNAQNYHAFEGSPYAGGLGLDNNPASILATPYPWDVTIFSYQLKNSTNAVQFKPVSLLSFAQDTVHFTYRSGDFSRYAALNFNIHLLNFRLALGQKQSIAFGINLRGYMNTVVDPVNYSDSIRNMNQFFNVNGNTVYNGNMVSSTFGEIFFTYARTLIDDEMGRLNGGITIRVSRGLSGAFAQLGNGAVSRTIQGPQTVYNMKAGSLRYAYSENLDRWTNTNTTAQNIYQVTYFTLPGGSLDLGLEYLAKSQGPLAWDAEDDYYDYDWKIGLSILDIGAARYKYGNYSGLATDPLTSVSDSVLQARFSHVHNMPGFVNAMQSIVQNFSILAGNFTIWNPTRLVINIDRPLRDHFALNAGLSLNLTPANKYSNKFLFVKDMTLLTFVPRWETKNLGAYLPMQVTQQGQVWVGGAFKVGPLLLGVHNWANVFSKSSIQNGGFYLALVIRPGNGYSEREDKRYGCPKF